MTYKSLVKKEKINAIIRTEGEKIEGSVHIIPETRLLDLLNSEREQFIPVKEAKVYSETSGKLLYESEFIAVNKNHVIVIIEGQPSEPALV